MTSDIGQAFKEMYKIVEAFEEQAQSLVSNMNNAIAQLEGAVGAETSKLKSQVGHSPDKDTEEVVDDEPELDADERLALAKASIEQIELRGTITKYRTHHEDGTPRGWLIKLLDENDQESDDGNEWLCRVFVKWIQELPLEISLRDERNNRDRSYPASSKRSIYVNHGEMIYIEELAKEQEILVQEKEFNIQ
jgi:hypothetical protein